MDLTSVFQLIERLDVEVRGRQSPTASRESMLNRFVAGKLSPTDRDTVCGWLRNEPELIEWVAKEVKARRKRE